MGWRKEEYQKDDNYVKSIVEKYSECNDKKTVVKKKVEVEGNREDYVSDVGRRLME